GLSSPRLIQKSKFNGQLFTFSNEHKNAVNEISVHENKSWFISGSSDSSVKLWNTQKMEGDFTLSSKLTYTINTSGGIVLSVSLQKVHNNCCASTDKGWIHIFD